jgi:hypothetical protein
MPLRPTWHDAIGPRGEETGPEAAGVERMKAIVVLSVFGVAILLLPGGALAMPLGQSLHSPIAQSTSAPSASGSVVVGSARNVSAVAPAFWGLNTPATQPFTKTDATHVSATPVTYILFPGGRLGENLNYTSNRLTFENGTHQQAATSVRTFIASCRSFGCQAILQLPAEINAPKTAAYYANYVVHTLHFQPAYWEIGNAPSGWSYYGIPWSHWGSRGVHNTTPTLFANEVKAYITAVKAVDSSGHFLALGSGLGPRNYSKSWVTELAKVDGHNLAGISIHSYILTVGPSHPTWAQLFANLRGYYSLPLQVAADRADIKAVCSTCTKLDVFVTEINAAEFSNYSHLLPSFAGTLYIAAETVQGLSLQVPNLDWFAYDSNFTGSWLIWPNHWQKQYYLFTDIMPHLENGVLPTAVTGPTTFYAVATYNSSGLALLMVNVNTTSSVSVDVSRAGFVMGASATQYLWKNGTSRTVKSSLTISKTFSIPALSIALVSVGPKGVQVPSAVPATLAPGSDAARSLSSPDLEHMVVNAPSISATAGQPVALTSLSQKPRRLPKTRISPRQGGTFGTVLSDSLLGTPRRGGGSGPDLSIGLERD